jgi:anti-sigma regulatory factor (Ser/Thr protein kinase)
VTETTDRSRWFPPDLESIPEARRFVEASLASDLTSDCLDVVKLMVSELVTNSVVHARSRFVVQLEYHEAAGRVRVEVVDRGPGEPIPLYLPPDEEGRGLRIVEQLANDWGWSKRPGGKVVWCEFECGRAVESSVSRG